MLLGSSLCANVCVCGDFNAIRYEEERKGHGLSSHQFDFDHFNKFIKNN